MAAFDHAQHTTFRLLNPSARCCNTNIMSGRINAMAWVSGGQALKPSDCESACRALPECTHFSHSLTWRNCNLCHGCPWEDNGVVGRRYTSWAKSEKCLITSYSRDGVGHQLHAKLSCAIAAHGLGEQVEYVEQPMEVAEHETLHRKVTGCACGRAHKRRRPAPPPASCLTADSGL